MFLHDPRYAVELLNSILEDGDQGELLIALRQMADAFGGVDRSAELNHSQLYRTLSDKGNPKVRSLTAILRVMSLRLAIQPIQSELQQCYQHRNDPQIGLEEKRPQQQAD